MGLSGVKIDLKGVFDGLSKVGQVAKDIRAAITGKEILDPTKQAELENKLAEFDYLMNKTQTDINKIEAQSPKTFIAGWRPFVGWACGIGFVWATIVMPTLVWILILLGKTPVLPKIEVSLILNVLLAMLGMAGLRTFEKYKGCEKNR